VPFVAWWSRRARPFPAGGDAPTSRRVRLAVAGVVALAALTGCGDLEDAAAAGSARDDLAGDLAAQLSAGDTLTYSAGYQLAGGRTATVARAQDPARIAYVYPGGKTIVTADATIRCEQAAKTLTCTMTAPLVLTAPLPAAAFARAGKAGMVLPGTVLTLLNAASLDPDKTVRQHDTTIAGHHATCIETAGVDGAEAGGFTACITSEGVLASFTGRLGGEPVDVAMTHYSDAVDADAFEPPPNARLLDHRTPDPSPASTGDHGVSLSIRPNDAHIITGAGAGPGGQTSKRVRRWRGGGEPCASIASCQALGVAPNGRAAAMAATSV
jgi:hypothetical protein